MKFLGFKRKTEVFFRVIRLHHFIIGRFERPYSFGPAYLDQWGPSKEEPKQIGHDVVTDHDRDRDDEPETGGHHDNGQREYIR